MVSFLQWTDFIGAIYKAAIKEESMFKVTLINMPFAALSMPSLALTQLKAVVEKEFEDQVSVTLLYLNHDFASYLGLGLYNHIANSMQAHTSGLGDWFFRQAAFPEEVDNTSEYLRRYYLQRDQQFEMLKRVLLDKRRGLDDFLDGLISKYHIDEAELVGFTSMFMQNIACFAMARHIKESNRKIITIMGGANCESPMGQEIVKNVKDIDFVFSGPGLKSFPDFIQNCFLDIDASHVIRGVFSKKNYALQPHGAIGEEVPIDLSIALDYDPFLQEMEKRFPNGEIKPTLLFETSRGCWWGERAHCTFCGLNGMTMAYRSMKPEKALEQFNSLFQYSDRVSHLESVDNILPKNYLEEVLPHLDTPSNMTLFYEVKADLAENDVATLSKARVKHIQPGVESLATSTLKLMKKGTSVFTNLVLLKNCVMYGIKPIWNLLIGFPGEEAQVYEKYIQDIPLLTHLYPPNGVYPVRFDRYSPYFAKADEYGLDLHPLDYYSLSFPFSGESLANFAYYFSDHTVGAKYALDMTKWIDRIDENIGLWAARWNDATAPHPTLYLKQNGASSLVHDSRLGKAIEHEISDTGMKILEQLDRPGRLSDIVKDFGHRSDFDAEKELAHLREKGLIFEEGGRLLSLAFPREPQELLKP